MRLWAWRFAQIAFNGTSSSWHSRRNYYTLIRFPQLICIIFPLASKHTARLNALSEMKWREKIIFFLPQIVTFKTIYIAEEVLECKCISTLLDRVKPSTGNYRCRFKSQWRASLRCSPIHRFTRSKMNNSVVNKSCFLSSFSSAIKPSPHPIQIPLQYKVFSPCKAQTFISPGECFIAYRNSIEKKLQEKMEKKKNQSKWLK